MGIHQNSVCKTASIELIHPNSIILKTLDTLFFQPPVYFVVKQKTILVGLD